MPSGSSPQDRLIRAAMEIKRKRSAGIKLSKKEKENRAAVILAKRYEKYLSKSHKKNLSKEEKVALILFAPGKMKVAAESGRGSFESRKAEFLRLYNIDAITPEMEFALMYSTPGQVASVFGIEKRVTTTSPRGRRYKKVSFQMSEVEVSDAVGYDAWRNVSAGLRGYPINSVRWEPFISETYLFRMVDEPGIFYGAFSGGSCIAERALMYEAAKRPGIKSMIFPDASRVLVNPRNESDSGYSYPFYYYKDEYESAYEFSPDFASSRVAYRLVPESSPEYNSVDGEIIVM